MGGTEIWLVNGASETLAKSSVYDTGIYELDLPGKATAIKFIKVSGSNDKLGLSQMRVY